MVVATEGVRVDAALTMGVSVSSSGLGVSVERPDGSAGMIVNVAVIATYFAAVIAVHAAARGASMVVVVPVIKRVAPGIVRVVVIDHGSVMPIESPMIPAPPITSIPTDSEAGSEPEVRAAVPDSGIRIPSRPRHQGISVNCPGIIGGDVNHFGVGRLNDDRRVLRRHCLLRSGLKGASFLRVLTHHLYGIHHVPLLVVVSVA